MRIMRRGWPVIGLCLLVLRAAGADPVTLIATNSTWRYFKGTAEPTPSNRAAWRATAFNDSGWASGRTPFWYGEEALFSGRGTRLADMQNRYSTVYLRQRFTVENPADWEALELNAACDDGFIAWINGTEVINRGGPTGPPAYNSVAAVNAPEPVTYTADILPDPSTLLAPGENVLAVQVFNVSRGSSDLVFDAELIGIPRPVGPPLIIAVDPVPGPIHSLETITVTFNEPVRGVRAEDFLVNGSSATSVSGSGATYTFTFPPPALGTVEIFWSTFHTIEDFEDPPQRFEIAAPGSTWAYELIDPEGPSIIVRQPPAGATVQSLAQLEVSFNKAVTGIDATDLLIDGVPATSLSGFGAGPYLFEFPARTAGPARISWSANHGITSVSLEPKPFVPVEWSYVVDPTAPIPALVITEIMAENFTAYRDEDEDPEDWIEIHNPTSSPVNLEGWALANDDNGSDLWTFPRVTLSPGAYLVVFASGKDRRPTTANAPLHTHFKLNPNGGYVGLFPPELPRRPISEVQYPIQGPDYSWGRENDTGEWRYFRQGTPGSPNPASSISESVGEVLFSVQRGFFSAPFNLHLSCPTPGAYIRFTTNGSPPTETTGFLYTNAIRITANRVIRAAAFKSNALPSRVATHTYLMNLPAARLRLPALSLVTDTNHLYGRNGIMEVNPRNTTRHGPAWERPVSVELIRVEDNGGFQTDCGIRIQGGDYVRQRYNYRSTELPFSKYSYRLYFRGEYGDGRLDYPLFPGTTQQSFDTIVLRAGMNDHSNPFILDEFVRSLVLDCGQPSPVGTFVHLFLNGVYKGYYNPCERIDVDFLRAYHGGGDSWDIMAQAGEVREGDATAWNALRNIANSRNLADPVHYRDLASRLDLTNFVDYLCPLIYVDNDDWPHNNWRAARERAPGALYRMYPWDCEWSFGFVNGHGPSWNTIQNQLSNVSPPWGSADIQRIFNGLMKSPEFRLLFADRVHRHFFNGGALTDERIRARYSEITNRLNGAVSGFNNRIATAWIPQRRRYVLQHFDRAGLLASSNAPAFSQHGGRIAPGFTLAMTNLAGAIYYTTNGSDPRVAFTGEIAPDAVRYEAPIPISGSVVIEARSLNGSNWSAVTTASFLVDQPASPVRITELMYNPAGGQIFQFIEIANVSSLPVDLSGFSFTGIEFRFPEGSPPLNPGERWVLADDTRPDEFQARYPDVTVMGWFDGDLRNSGERIEFLDRSGRVVDAVEYGDIPPWPIEADGNGASLELVDLLADASDPAAWVASAQPGGSPGIPNPARPLPTVRISEIASGPGGSSDWIELENTGDTPADLTGWSLSDNANPRRFVFPAESSIAPGARVRIWFSANAPAGEWRTGFGLSSEGETIALYEPSGTRADAVTVGTIPEGYTVGRIEGEWQLCEPTPGAPNEPAVTAGAEHLAINEWFPNPISGADDWIEIHNMHESLPVGLRGLRVATSNAWARIGAHSYVPPAGFVVLVADELPGPQHLGLRLPAAGGMIALQDATGAELTRVTYTAVQESVSVGRFPDGTGDPIEMLNSASPGASNYVASVTGPRFNEWMARNHGATRDPHGRFADWLELHNPAGEAFDLSGAQLRFDDSDTRPWRFPAGTQIPAGGYLLVWCDPDQPSSTAAGEPLNTGRGLPDEGGRLQLLTADGRVLDRLEYGPQIIDGSVGRSGDAMVLLETPTPGAANSGAAALGATSGVRFNEWLTRAQDDTDWFEMFNSEALPVDLAGHYVTDDPSLSGVTKSRLPPVSLIPARGHQLWYADGQVELGPNHLSFRLSGDGESLRLYTPNRTLIDGIDFGFEISGSAEGRFPDGSEAFARFPESASPGQANWLPHPGVVINEILTHAAPPLEDAIELYNPSGEPVSLDGWTLSDDPRRPDKQPLPTGIVIPPGGYRVLYESQFNAPNTPGAFSLDAARGGSLWLSERSEDGTLTGYGSRVVFGPAAMGVSFGRYRTSAGWDFTALSRRTFGKDAPGSLAEFRQGTGLPNAYPLVGPVVLTEVHYRPLSSGAIEVPEFEFVEIHNSSSQTVPLHDPTTPGLTWRLAGAIDFQFPPQSQLEPGEFAVVVRFSPLDAATASAFREQYNVPTSVRLYGPFSGRLSNEADDVRLERPDPTLQNAGWIPYLTVERVKYFASSPWPELGSLESLQRRRAAEYGNDPANWIAATPTPGSATRPPAGDRDFDGMPDDWELAHGLNPDDPADSVLDADGDGFSNHMEYLAGTDPRDPASALRLALLPEGTTGSGLVIQFRAVAGRTYTILERAQAGSGEWRSLINLGPLDSDQVLTWPVETSSSIPSSFFMLSIPSSR